MIKLLPEMPATLRLAEICMYRNMNASAWANTESVRMAVNSFNAISWYVHAPMHTKHTHAIIMLFVEPSLFTPDCMKSWPYIVVKEGMSGSLTAAKFLVGNYDA